MNRGRPPRRAMQVMGYVRDYVEIEGRVPSYGEICTGVGIKTRQEVSRIVACLERDRMLARVGAGKIRRIRLAHLC